MDAGFGHGAIAAVQERSARNHKWKRVLWGVALFVVLLSGCTTGFTRRSADKEAYQLIGEKQHLVPNMEPRFSIEQTNGFESGCAALWTRTNTFLGRAAEAEAGARVLSLESALAIAIHQSRLYQNNKETALFDRAGSLVVSSPVRACLFPGRERQLRRPDRSDSGARAGSRHRRA